jgi:hypothetical protein
VRRLIAATKWQLCGKLASCVAFQTMLIDEKKYFCYPPVRKFIRVKKYFD